MKHPNTLRALLALLALMACIEARADDDRYLLLQVRQTFGGPSVTRLELRYLSDEQAPTLRPAEVPALTLYSSNPAQPALLRLEGSREGRGTHENPHRHTLLRAVGLLLGVGYLAFSVREVARNPEELATAAIMPSG